jgi:hypothetical protein
MVKLGRSRCRYGAVGERALPAPTPFVDGNETQRPRHPQRVLYHGAADTGAGRNGVNMGSLHESALSVRHLEH